MTKFVVNLLECHLAVIGNISIFEKVAIGRSPDYLYVSEIVRPLSFHSFYPVPPYLQGKAYSREAREWEMKHWGCKWGARNVTLLDKSSDHCIIGFLLHPCLQSG